MKKLFFIVPVISGLILSISCQKEDLAPGERGETDPQVFTCTLEGEKTSIDGDNCPVWQEGDFIILYNGAKANTASKTGQTSFQVMENGDPMFYVSGEAVTNNIVERIDITSDMISADGRTVTFKKSIDDAESAYYAVAENAASHLVYAIRTDGKLTFREASSHTDAGSNPVEIVHAAVATCAAGSNSLTFRNVFCQFKFDVSKGKYQRVTFEANAESANTFVCGVSQMPFDASSCGTAANKKDPYTIYLNNQENGPYYVPVAASANLDKGITIKCYKSSGDTEPYVLTISKPLPLQRGRIINLGNLDQVKPVTSYYESWEEGNDILINGMTYNKSTYGAGRLVTTDTEFTAAEDIKGAIFVAEGASVTIPSGNVRPKGSVIIMCDKPGKMANLIINGTIIPQTDNMSIIFNALNITNNKNALSYASRPVEKIGFYGCKLSMNVTNFSYSSNSMISNTEVIGCDIKTTVADIGLFDGSLNGGVKIQTIIFNNNIVYSGDGTLRKFCAFRQGRASIVDNVGLVEMKNNTFYDINFGSNGLCSPASVDEFYLENNIFAFSASYDTHIRCLWISSDDANPGKTAPVTGYPAEGKVMNNIRYNTQTVLGCMYPNERLADKSWYPSAYSEITTAAENPFSTEDANNGIFTQKTAFATYGAKR